MENIVTLIENFLLKNVWGVITAGIIASILGTFLCPYDDDTYQWASSIFKNGRIYVIEIIESHICFSPSRFVGYKDNTKEKHQKNHGDGNQTNDVLKNFYQKVQDERLDVVFQKNCLDIICHQAQRNIGFQTILQSKI